MCETVLITGASGLLGRALVARFAAAGFQVLAQYRRHPGRKAANVQWLQGDFATPGSTAAFLGREEAKLRRCRLLLHNYGPITLRPTARATGEQLLADFAQQVVPAVDITRFLIARAPLQAVMSIGFEYSGEIRAYRHVLGYAMGKNSLLLLTRSWAAAHAGIRFSFFSPPSLEKARVLPQGAQAVPAERVAERIFRLIHRRRSGCHYRYSARPRTRVK